MTIKKSYSSDAACVMECASPLALSPSIRLDRRPVLHPRKKGQNCETIPISGGHKEKHMNATITLAPERDLPQVAARRSNALFGLANPAICGEARVVPARSGLRQSARRLTRQPGPAPTHQRHLLYAAPGVKKVENAKRTQFHSKHIVLQILTTQTFLFRPKANLMIQNGAPRLTGCSSERELALIDVLISDLWIINSDFGRLRKVTERSPMESSKPHLLPL